jgi:hypothetical protein
LGGSAEQIYHFNSAEENRLVAGALSWGGNGHSLLGAGFAPGLKGLCHNDYSFAPSGLNRFPPNTHGLRRGL